MCLIPVLAVDFEIGGSLQYICLVWRQRQRLANGIFRRLPPPLHVLVAQRKPGRSIGISKFYPCQREVRVEFDGLFQSFNGTQHGCRRELLGQRTAAQEFVERLHVGRATDETPHLADAEADTQRRRNSVGNFVLDRKHVPVRSFVGVRPQVKSGLNIDELCGDAQLAAFLAHTAFEYVSDRQLSSNRA